MKWDHVEAGILHIKNLVKVGGWQLNLHYITGNDEEDLFHSHPAWSLRFILKGGYTEELPTYRLKGWFPLSFGVVRPEFVHRIDAVKQGGSWTLWLRGPITHEITVYRRVRGALQVLRRLPKESPT